MRKNAYPLEHIALVKELSTSRTAKEIAKELGKYPEYVYRIARKHNIQLFRGTPREPNIDIQMARTLYKAGYRLVDIHRLNFSHITYQGLKKHVCPTLH